jgi:hypothetical protein
MHSIRRIALFGIVFNLCFAACKKEETTQRFEGRVLRGNNGGALSGVRVEAQTQELGNGVFNSEYSTLASTTTDGTGNYRIPFEMATYTSLRLEFTKSQYHRRWIDVDPSHFDQNDVFSKTVSLYPQATIALRISDGSAEYNQIQFRYKDIDFECTCCNDSWKVIDQPNIDTTISCMVYGDQMVHYQYRWIATGVDSLVQDSIYCPAFTTQNIDLNY